MWEEDLGNPGNIINRGQVGDPANQFASENAPSVFNCPSTPLLDAPANWQKDYGINGGQNDALWGGCCPERTQANMNGIAYVWSAMRLPDISDGTSNTLHGPGTGPFRQP